MVSRIYRAECNESRLRSFLTDDLSERESSHLAKHLDSCADCRRKLEQLAGGSRLWAELRQLAPTPGSAPETEFHRTSPYHDKSSLAEETPLEFLAPSNFPGSLGRLGSYEVMGVLGRGGFGVVLRAYDPALSRTVAIKVLASYLATSAAARSRFAREARAAAAVVHENVVAIHAVDDWKGLPYLVMPYIAGRSVQQRVDHDGPLQVKEILRIGMQTAEGLAAAHAQGLVHRDVKPSNILLENGVERVKLSDFGLARAVDDASLTQSGVVAGTPQYMSPEQANGDAVDHRSDLFGLGSVLYFMGAGHPPFRANSTPAVLLRVCDDQPRPLREINSDIPEGLAAIIAKLHAKNPAHRYASATEVAEVFRFHLAELQRTGSISAPHPKTLPAVEKRKRTMRMTPVILAAVAGLAIAVAAVPPLLSAFDGDGGQVVVNQSPNRSRRPGLLNFLFRGAQSDNKRIVGSGVANSKAWEVADFSAVSIESAFHADIIKGDGFRVITSSDDNILDHIRVVKEGTLLKVGVDHNLRYRTKTPLHVEITLPKLSQLSLSAATQASLKGFNAEQDIKLSLGGASTLVGELQAAMTDLQIHGASKVSLVGGTGEVKLSVQGASHASLARFLVNAGKVKLGGSSHGIIAVQATEPFEASASGSSTLEGFVNAQKFKLQLDGSSTAKLEGAAKDILIHADGASDAELPKLIIDAKEMKVTLNGASSARLQGKVESMSLKGDGASHFQCDGLVANTAMVALSGASDAAVDVRKTLNYMVSSGSHLRYSGNPAEAKGRKSSGASVNPQR